MQEAITKIHVPQNYSKIYKEECTLCFKNQVNFFFLLVFKWKLIKQFFKRQIKKEYLFV